MQAHAQQVAAPDASGHRLHPAEQVEQLRQGAVGHDHVPGSIDDHRRKRFVYLEHALHRAAPRLLPK